VALRRAARGRRVMVDARAGVVSMRPVRQHADLDAHGAPVETRLRGGHEDEEEMSAGEPTDLSGERAPLLHDSAGPGPGPGPDAPRSWEDALDRPAPTARPAPSDLFQGTDPVLTALGAARLQATVALSDLPVRESKDEDEEFEAGGGSRRI